VISDAWKVAAFRRQHQFPGSRRLEIRRRLRKRHAADRCRLSSTRRATARNVAEGVETRADFLRREMGFDKAQGFRSRYIDGEEIRPH
jgi:hypothetical protein